MSVSYARLVMAVIEINQTVFRSKMIFQAFEMGVCNTVLFHFQFHMTLHCMVVHAHRQRGLQSVLPDLEEALSV